MKRKWPKNSPRYQAGGFTLKEGTGPTTHLQSCGKFLEVYKKDKTFRVQTPESIDPEETNPNAPWTATPVADVGSSNLIVARVFIQSCEMLEIASFEKNIAIDALKMELHGIKEDLLVCESILNSLDIEIEQVRKEVEEEGVKSENGRMLNPFPFISNLDGQAASFLIHAKRALIHIGRLPSYFANVPSRGANFHKLGKQLQDEYGSESDIAKLVLEAADTVKKIVDLRNYQEHPGKKETVVENFKLTPDVTIMAPRWHITGEDEKFINEDMGSSILFILQTAEAIFIYLILQNISKSFPFIIHRIPDEEIDDDKPVMFKLTLDVGQFRSQE